MTKVLVAAPTEGALYSVYGINDGLYDPNRRHLVTAASCTTNCLAPVVKVMHGHVGIVHGCMTTIHAVTNTQTIVDALSPLVIGDTQVKVYARFDNEWDDVCRMMDIAARLAAGRCAWRRAIGWWRPLSDIGGAEGRMEHGLRDYLVVTGGYWAFTVTDGAIRMLVVLYFHLLGYSPFEVAMLFLFYEFVGIVTNLVGGWLGARIGLDLTMHIGMTMQVAALAMLTVPDAWLSVAYVMAAALLPLGLPEVAPRRAQRAALPS